MMYSVSCDQAGCSHFIRAPGRDLAAVWLWSHLVKVHGLSPAVVSLEELKKRPKFDVNDKGEAVGMPYPAKILRGDDFRRDAADDFVGEPWV